MKYTQIILCIFFFLTTTKAFSQAVIDSSNLQKTVYVNINHINADDTNSGLDPESPVKSLQKAIDLCADTASRIIIYPGHYRSYIDINSDQLLIIEAAEYGKVYISGSDVFENWQPQDTLYAHTWEYDWGYFDDSNFCFGPCNLSDYQKRRELLFINGNAVTQVVKKSNLKENTFYVDEENDQILLNPPAGADIASATIEVSTRGFNVYNEGRNGSLVIASVFNDAGLILRGLTFQHTANTPHQDALTISNTNNLLVENCVFQWNNGVGFQIQNCSNTTLQNLIARYNGERGMGVSAGSNILISNVDLYENNWRTNAAKIIAHDAAGIKLAGGIENCIMDNIQGWNNYCPAIWFDWNNGDYTIKNSTFKHNQEEGIMLEASRKPARIENCTFLYNGVGIMGYGHANVTVDSCFFFANGAQISLGQDGRTVSQDNDWEINSRNWTIKNTHVISATPTQSMFSFFTYFNPSTDPTLDYYETVTADSNTYFHPVDDERWPDDNSSSGERLSFAEWKNATSQDLHSVWMKPTPDMVGGNEEPVAVLEYNFFADTVLQFYADKSYDPENLINSYKWYFGDGETSDKKNVNHFYRSKGSMTVSLVVTDFFGAKDSVSVTLNIGTGIEAPFLMSEMKGYVYPNPTSGEVFFTTENSAFESDLIHCRLFNHTGQLVLQKGNVNLNRNTSLFNISHLPAGIYYVEIGSEKHMKQKFKLIKQ